MPLFYLAPLDPPLDAGCKRLFHAFVRADTPEQAKSILLARHFKNVPPSRVGVVGLQELDAVKGDPLLYYDGCSHNIEEWLAAPRGDVDLLFRRGD